jgi:hypothetical protein
LKADPALIRVFGECDRSAGEPGFASEPIDFLGVRDALDWSLAPVWGLSSSAGETPIVPRRLIEFYDHTRPGWGRFDIEGVSHVLTSSPLIERKGPDERSYLGRMLFDRFAIYLPGTGPGQKAGSAYIYKNPFAMPRARLMGRPLYVAGERDAIGALDRLGPSQRDRLVVEDPFRPLPESADVSGTATIRSELPERVEVEVDAQTDAYLILSDTYDPGWSATLDGRYAPIRPAWVAFRAVFARRSGNALASDHDVLTWPRRWPLVLLSVLVLILLVSAVQVDRKGHLSAHSRWEGSFHRFTWGAGIEAMREKGVR